MIEVMENTLSLMCDELSLDPFLKLQERLAIKHQNDLSRPMLTDSRMFTVTYLGKTCFLGNTLSFRLLKHLEQRPNAHFSYENLLSEVWQSHRSDTAIRSVVKTLRQKLRMSGLVELADAIDGSVAGHYALKLASTKQPQK